MFSISASTRLSYFKALDLLKSDWVIVFGFGIYTTALETNVACGVSGRLLRSTP